MKKMPQKIFTMIELLIVIAIIAILASMILPALSRARETAKAIKCTSNVKQVMLAQSMYAIDNNEYMVMGSKYAAGYVAWTSLMQSGKYLTTKVLNCPSVTKPINSLGKPLNQFYISYGFPNDWSNTASWGYSWSEYGNFFVFSSSIGLYYNVRKMRRTSNIYLAMDTIIGNPANSRYQYGYWKWARTGSVDDGRIHVRHQKRTIAGAAAGNVTSFTTSDLFLDTALPPKYYFLQDYTAFNY